MEKIEIGAKNIALQDAVEISNTPAAGKPIRRSVEIKENIKSNSVRNATEEQMEKTSTIEKKNEIKYDNIADDAVEQLPHATSAVVEATPKKVGRVQKTVHIEEQISNTLSAHETERMSFENDIETISEFENDDFIDSYSNTTKEKVALLTLDDFFKMHNEHFIELKTEDTKLIIAPLPRLPPVDDPYEGEIFFDPTFFWDDSSESEQYQTSLSTNGSADESQLLEKFPSLRSLRTMASVKTEGLDNEPIQYKAIKPTDGQFVHPLTGRRLVQPIIELKPQLSQQADQPTLENGTESEKEAEVDEEINFDAFDATFTEEKKVVFLQKIEEEEGEEDFEKMVSKQQTSLQASLVTFVPVKDLTEVREIEDHTEKFLNNLIARVVKFCDEEESTRILQRSLDKNKLFEAIVKTVNEIDMETVVRTFLCRKAIDYYRRKRNLRNLSEDLPSRVLQDREKYKEVLVNLDRLMGIEVYMTQKNKQKIDDCAAEAVAAEEAAKIEIDKFEELLKASLKCEGKPRLEDHVLRALREMNNLRNEISIVRSKFIMTQHTLGKLKAEIKDCEKIHGTLRLQDYETLKRHIRTLTKKIEDRNEDLARLRNSVETNLHTVAHRQLKTEVLLENLGIQKEEMAIYNEEKNSTRDHLFSFKLKKRRLRNQINEISSQSGLLDKPALMHDFDDVVDTLMAKRALIKQMRKTQSELEHKLKSLLNPKVVNQI